MEKRISVEGVSKRFRKGFVKKHSALWRFLSFLSGRAPEKIITALNGISFDVREGEKVSIIGENGSGKTTLLRVLSGIYASDEGRVETRGKIISLINLRVGMMARLSMKDNIYLLGSFFGLSPGGIKERLHSIAAFAEQDDYISIPLYQFSSGMLQRLAFSIAINCDPDILLLDEVFEAGDENFRNKSAESIQQLASNGGSVILVSHEMEMIEKCCDRAIWLRDGKVFESGDTEDVVSDYIRYSRGVNPDNKACIE